MLPTVRVAIDETEDRQVQRRLHFPQEQPGRDVGLALSSDDDARVLVVKPGHTQVVQPHTRVIREPAVG